MVADLGVQISMEIRAMRGSCRPRSEETGSQSTPLIYPQVACNKHIGKTALYSQALTRYSWLLVWHSAEHHLRMNLPEFALH